MKYMKSRENRDIRTKGGKKVNVGMTENGKLRKIHFISIFSFIMRMSKQAKFSVCERMFVCQHKLAKDWEPVSYFVHPILHGGHGEGKLPKFPYKISSDVLEGVSSHLVLATGRTFPFLAPS